MNRICLTGRATAKPELKYNESKIGICRFTLAVNRGFKNSNGEYESDFINIVAFKSTAEIIEKYVEKGDLIGIVGRIQTRNYDDKEGKKVYVTEIVVEHVEFLQQKKKDESIPTPKEEKIDPFKEFGKEIELEESDWPF